MEYFFSCKSLIDDAIASTTFKIEQLQIICIKPLSSGGFKLTLWIDEYLDAKRENNTSITAKIT